MAAPVRSTSDHLIPSAGVDIAVRDHAGDGPAVVLLHGGGRTMEDWRPVVPPLVEAGLRVVTADLRGHGRSGPALWSWPAALDDLTRVVDHRGLEAPAVVGHSLGGLVAALWATGHPECPLAANLDGHTNPTGPFDGLTEEESLAARDVMRAFLDTSLEEAADPALTRLVAELGDLDLFGTYRATRCPLLVVSTARLGAEELLPADVAAAFEAYKRGFARELAAVAASTPLLSLATIPTSHDVHLEAPAEVAEMIIRRVSGHEPVAG